MGLTFHSINCWPIVDMSKIFKEWMNFQDSKGLSYIPSFPWLSCGGWLWSECRDEARSKTRKDFRRQKGRTSVNTKGGNHFFKNFCCYTGNIFRKKRERWFTSLHNHIKITKKCRTTITQNCQKSSGMNSENYRI